jgi:predicted hydrolase (HD superfamily)
MTKKANKMKTSITYAEALGLWNKYVSTPHLRIHMRESEVVMRKLANYFNADAEFWGIAGLLHDLDLDKLGLDYTFHGYTTVEMLREEGYEIPELFDAIIAHTEGVTSAKRKTNFDIILAAAENITGIITAYVLILPDKKIAGVKASSIKKRLKQLRFAASVNREFIYDIEKTGIQLDVFLTLAIEAMTEIADEIDM